MNGARILQRPAKADGAPIVQRTAVQRNRIGDNESLWLRAVGPPRRDYFDVPESSEARLECCKTWNYGQKSGVAY